ncbi:MAG: flavodoxin [Bacteroidales bacterium]|nr:flavodoxin [Bacteroidales bacterium]
MKHGLFYGSTTGNCELVAKLIQQALGHNLVDIYDLAYTDLKEAEKYSNLIFGTSTWGIGDMQEDWQDKIHALNDIDLTGKVVALYGLGDQGTYSESFADALAILHNTVKKLPCKLVGQWPAKDYSFDSSKALVNKFFVGLVLDEDTQSDMTATRVDEWCTLIKPAFL